MDRSVAVPAANVALSTASVYPEPAAVGFSLAAELGYDAVEVMVALDETSQDVDTVRRLSDDHQLRVIAVRHRDEPLSGGELGSKSTRGESRLAGRRAALCSLARLGVSLGG